MEDFNNLLQIQLSESRLPSDGSDPQFALPEEKKFPLYDEKHVRSAIKLFSRYEGENKTKLASAISRKMNKYGISIDEVGNDNPLKEYLTEEYESVILSNILEDEEILTEAEGKHSLRWRLILGCMKYVSEESFYEIFPEDRILNLNRKQRTEKLKKALNSIPEEKKSELKKLQKVKELEAKTEKIGNKYKIAGRLTGLTASIAGAASGVGLASVVINNVKQSADNAGLAGVVAIIAGIIVGILSGCLPLIIGGTASLVSNSVGSSMARKAKLKYSIENSEDKIVELLKQDCNDKENKDMSDVITSDSTKEVVMAEMFDLESFHDDLMNECLRESVLDPINKERCKNVFDDNDKMKEDVRKFILDIVEGFKKEVSFNIKHVYMIGSSTGYQYTLTSDIDIEVETDLPKNKLWNVIKLVPKGTLLPGTQQPVNLFVLDNDTQYDFKNAENVYDVVNSKWLKDTGKQNVQIPYPYIKGLATYFMDGCDSAISEYYKDEKELTEYMSLDPNTQEISEKEKVESIDRKIVDLKKDIDALKMAHHVIFGFEKEGYEGMPFKIMIDSEINDKEDRYSVNNLVYKYIDKFGYLDMMNEVMRKGKEKIKEAEAYLKKSRKDNLQEDYSDLLLEKRLIIKSKKDGVEKTHFISKAGDGKYDITRIVKKPNGEEHVLVNQPKNKEAQERLKVEYGKGYVTEDYSSLFEDKQVKDIPKIDKRNGRIRTDAERANIALYYNKKNDNKKKKKEDTYEEPRTKMIDGEEYIKNDAGGWTKMYESSNLFEDAIGELEINNTFGTSPFRYKISDVLTQLYPIVYGFISTKDGSRIDDREFIHNCPNLGDIYKVNYDPTVTIKNKLGICTDQSLATEYLIKTLHPEIIPELYALTKGRFGHCVCTLKDTDDKYYYLENAWDKKRGLWGPFNDKPELEKYLSDTYHWAHDKDNDDEVSVRPYLEYLNNK